MASIIRIKRSGVSGNPATLAAGELAYSALTDDGSNGGDRLYIGFGTETGGNAANHYVIGGKYFTDMLDHAKGTLTASSALVVDASSKLDNLKVDDLDLNGSTISTTNTNGNLTLFPNGSGKIYLDTDLIRIGDGGSTATITTNGATDLVINTNGGTDSGSITITDGTDQNITISPNGSGKIVLDGQSWPNAAGTNGYYLKTDNSGVLEWAAIPSGSFTVAAESGTNQSFTTGNTFTIAAGEGIDTAVSKVGNDVTITVSGEDATTTNKGIASFSTDNFAVTDGAVTIKDGGIANIELVNSAVTVGTTSISLGASSTTIAGLTQIDVNNIRVTGNTISSTNGNGNVVLDPNGSGSVDVSGAKITNLGTPTADTDAATKAYVDATKSGLDVKQSVRLATTDPLTANYSNGTDGVGATLTNADTQAALTLDGVPAVNGDRVLIKNQATALQNGIYTVTDIGSISTNWVLTRATDFDQDAEVTGGAFTFVEAGNTQADNGYVMTANGTIDVGTDAITWVQFSGAGQITAGDGLDKVGNTLSVRVDDSTIEINADILRLKDAGTTFAKIQNVDALSVVGRAGNTAGPADEITAANDHQVLRRSGNSIGFGALDLGQTNAITGTLGVSNGGTGITSATTNGIIYGNNTSAFGVTAAGTWDSANGVGQLLSVNSLGVPTWTNNIDGGTY